MARRKKSRTRSAQSPLRSAIPFLGIFEMEAPTPDCRILVYCSSALLAGKRAQRALCRRLVAAFREKGILTSVLLVRLRGLSLPYIEREDSLEPVDAHGYTAYPEAFAVPDAALILLLLDGSPHKGALLKAPSSLRAHLADITGEMIHGHPKGWEPLVAWAPVFTECPREEALAPLRALTASLGAACAVLDLCALEWSKTRPWSSAEPLVELLVASTSFHEWRRARCF